MTSMREVVATNSAVSTKSAPSAYRATLFFCVDDPSRVGPAAATRTILDGLLVVQGGRVVAVGEALELLPTLPADCPVHVFSDCIIIPGFIDIHLHYVQTEMIGAFGEQLLDWLDIYAFPTEKKFADPAYSRGVAEVFLSELLRNGTTTAMVFGSVHAESVHAFFQAAQARGLRMIAGKVMMDRHAPVELLDTAQSSYAENQEIIARWHGRDRLGVAITPRFAPTSSWAQLERAGQLLQEHSGLYLQTHLSENRSELAWVQELFPDKPDYLSVYEDAGLLGPRTVFAHAIHLSPSEFERLGRSGSAIAFCPTSNLFLGSGLFDLSAARKTGCQLGFGTDVGAGTSFSMFHTMRAAYETQQLQGVKLHPFEAFYTATLGAARALGLEDKIGTLAPGLEADFVVLDCHATPLLEFRMARAATILEKLFAIIVLGDDRVVQATYSAGVCVHRRDGDGGG